MQYVVRTWLDTDNKFELQHVEHRYNTHTDTTSIKKPHWSAPPQL